MEVRMLAIDPGKKGAIAWIDHDDKPGFIKMPETFIDILEELKMLNPSKVYLENVAPFHMQGNNAFNSCKFANHYGHLQMALVALQIRFKEIKPKKWQAIFGTLSRVKKERKRLIKEKVQCLFPGVKMTNDNADAFGVLHFGMEQETVIHF